MKLINKLLLSLFIIGFSCFPFSAQESSSYFLHTIEKGQSLYSIASMYGVNQSDIISLNPGCNEKICFGQSLKIPQSKGNERAKKFHTIQPQETLYQLTVKYNLSAKTICSANPGLSAENFKIGQVIVIPNQIEATEKQVPVVSAPPVVIQPGVKPNCRDMHKVQKRETIFSICKEYGITEQELIATNPELKDGLKKGKFLCIPYAMVRPEVPKTELAPPSDKELFSESKASSKSLSVIKVAVVLPFMVDGAGNSNEVNRMVKYYEGLLMAVDSLKKTGISIDLYAYDSGSEQASILPILAKSEMKEMDVIFGPLHSEHIKPLADFAKKNNIRLVIPFTSKNNEVFNNPNIYQINTPQSYLYSEVYEHFTRKFTNANVIFLETGSINKEKAEFINGLKQELKNKHVVYKSLALSASLAAMKGVLSDTKENIFIPTSSSNITLIKVLPQLTMLVREEPTFNIHLFGYPEWQTYTKDHLAAFYELDTYFYTSFYTNNLFPQAINFNTSYRKWFGKDVMDSYPSFEMLGFDTAYFFLKGLSKHGSQFEKQVNNTNVTPIQTGFRFDRVNNWGGFINKKVFFVHFTKDFELIKLDFE
ncbi:MAG: LysM peptidoglycan-binding domain-containing protein [Bacteroidaceae bacterium]